MSHSFSPTVSPYLFQKRKNWSISVGTMAKADQKICHEKKRVCQHAANKDLRFKSREQGGTDNYALYTRRKRDVKDINSNGK